MSTQNHLLDRTVGTGEQQQEKSTFDFNRAIFVCDSQADALAAREYLGFVAFARGSIPPGALTGSVVVIASNDALRACQELVEAGAAFHLTRFVDLESTGETLRALASSDIERLRYLLSQHGHARFNVVRPIGRWEAAPEPEMVPVGIEPLNEHLRWRFPSLAVTVGGYGSGKSSATFILALASLVSEVGCRRDLQMSICAWEDERSDLQDRTFRFCMGGVGPEQRDEYTRRANLYQDMMDRRLHWIAPYEMNDRGLQQYIDHVRAITQLGIKVHIFDPWNSHDPELEPGERENHYIRRLMNQLHKLTKELGIVIIIITHTPKSATQDIGKIKPIRLKDASGSGDFATRADIGLCVVRTSYLAGLIKREITDDQDIDGRCVTNAIEAHGGWRPVEEHLILSVDKIKIEGRMGQRGVFAFVLDKALNNIALDPVATALLQRIWRV
jgi:hypothetical protein